MTQTWGMRCRQFLASGRNLKAAWLVFAGIVAFYFGAIRPREPAIGISHSRSTRLAAYSRPMFENGVVGGVPGGVGRRRNIVRASLTSAEETDIGKGSPDGASDRQTVRTNTLELLVQHPRETAEKIWALAEQNGGLLVSSEIRGGPEATVADLAVRVPVSRSEEVRGAIRKLGLRVESERVEAQDVTRRYTDQDANLRNLRAEERQYLQILKQANSVKDTLDVSEKLGEVRGQIEQQQAEFNALSKQIETVAINVSLRAQAEARILGLNWRPLYQIKMAARDGLDGVATYLSTMTSLIFFLPAVILWMATIILGGWVVWKILRRIAYRWFGRKRAQLA
jgi:hypothetical protein